MHSVLQGNDQTNDRRTSQKILRSCHENGTGVRRVFHRYVQTLFFTRISFRRFRNFVFRPSASGARGVSHLGLFEDCSLLFNLSAGKAQVGKKKKGGRLSRA